MMPYCPVPFANAKFPDDSLPVLGTVDDILNLSEDDLEEYLEGYGYTDIDLTAPGPIAISRRMPAAAIGVDGLLLGELPPGAMTRGKANPARR